MIFSNLENIRKEKRTDLSVGSSGFISLNRLKTNFCFQGISDVLIDEISKAIKPTDPALDATPYRNYDYKYNGKEWQDELGLNMYDMDMRMYDPAIARWVVMDPVIHHSMSPYNAFDNNPVFWADPSGADSESDFPPGAIVLTGEEAQEFIRREKKRIDDQIAQNAQKQANEPPSWWRRTTKSIGCFFGINCGNTKSHGGIGFGNLRIESELGEVLAEGGDIKETITYIWNHPITRTITGDKISINYGVSAGGIFGASGEGAVEILLRGPDAGIYLDPFNTGSFNITVGTGGEVYTTVGKSYFTGDISQMTLSSVVGTEAFLGGDVATPYGGVTGSISVSFDPKNPAQGPRWVTGSTGVTWGAKASVQGGIRYSNTRIGLGIDGQIKAANALETYSD